MIFDQPAIETFKNLSPSYLWLFFPIGYLTTIIIETPVLILGLSSKVKFTQKLFCGFWLTLCTYPVVVLVLPNLLGHISWSLYLVVAEIFAPLAECIIFWLIFRGSPELERKDWIRCFIAIILANLASFGIGEILNYSRWFGLF